MLASLDFLIPIIILIVHYFLSKQEWAWLGAIFPVLFVGFVIWLIIDGKLDATSFEIVPMILGLTLLLGVWIKGRESYKKSREKELNKMRVKDLQ